MAQMEDHHFSHLFYPPVEVRCCVFSPEKQTSRPFEDWREFISSQVFPVPSEASIFLVS